jgi:hypothetical protein
VEVGVLIPEDNYKTEYWMSIELQAVEDDEDPLTHLRILKELWSQRLREISPGVPQKVALMGDEFRVQFRYIFNGLRIWFVPCQAFATGLKRPLSEEPCSRDKWHSTTDLMAL